MSSRSFATVCYNENAQYGTRGYSQCTYDGLINANQILEDKKKSSRGELFDLKNEITKSKKLSAVLPIIFER